MCYNKCSQKRRFLLKKKHYGVFWMYYSTDSDQLIIEDFAMPFSGSLDPNNRWVKLSRIMPWDHIEQIYLDSMSVETGRRAISSRIAFGSIFIKGSRNFTDAECVAEIQENPYMQYFLGLHAFEQEPLFDASMMVHFRKRSPAEEVSRINEFVCTGKWPEKGSEDEPQPEQETQAHDEEEQDDDHKQPPKSLHGKKDPNTSQKKQRRQKKNKGKLIMDATVAPSDIKYPTDIDLLDQCRTHLEKAIDLFWEHVPHNGHKLPYSTKKARRSYLNISKSKKWTSLERSSWSNFNEGSDLKTVVEAYHRRFGFYPEAVLADRIYQTRENRRYCKELGIRLTGPALGRKKAGETGAKEARQMYRDSCERNAVEGRNGDLKRRYGLDRIMSKLEETSETESILNILAMNAAQKLRRWLMHFFRIYRLKLVFQ